MDLLNLLLSDWVGRLSLFTILFCIAMVVFLLVFFAFKVYFDPKENLNPPPNDHLTT